MLYSYDDCLKQFGNHYQIEKEISLENIYKIQPGVYSDKKRVSELEVLTFKYPYAVFTMDSAFYYHSLSDVVPNKYYLATSKDAYKIPLDRVKQYYQRSKMFEVGISSMQWQGVKINVYDQERMLIELIRYRKSFPFDYYKEVINNYRKRINQLDIEKLQKYILMFQKKDRIFDIIQLEVF